MYYLIGAYASSVGTKVHPRQLQGMKVRRRRRGERWGMKRIWIERLIIRPK